MVERLKIAIQKAQALRRGVQPFADNRGNAARRPVHSAEEELAAAWAELEEIELDPKHLEKNRIIAHARSAPAYITFDVLRTRILRTFREKGWTRIGITSPNKSSGKTFVSTNLAFSMSRQPQNRSMLIDMDLRLPNVSRVLGTKGIDDARWFLTGELPAEQYLRRVGSNLAIGLNEKRVQDSAELILDPILGQSLQGMLTQFAPDAVIYDLPPMLACDDVIGFLPHIDCILLVVGGGSTRAEEVSECERLLSEQTELLGVILNKAEDPDPTQYGYGYY